VKKTFLCLPLLFFTFGSLFAQEYPTGAILDDAIYQSLPRKAVQHSKALDILPKAFSLKQYAPYPGDQGSYGTCTAWATAYAGRTIMESFSLDRQNRPRPLPACFRRSLFTKTFPMTLTARRARVFPTRWAYW